MRCPTCSSQWWWTKEGVLEDCELHRYRLHLGLEEEVLINRDLGLGDEEELPVMDALEAEAVFLRLDVLRERHGDAPAGQDEAAEVPGHEGVVAVAALVT